MDQIRQFFINWLKMMNPPVFFGAGGIVIAFITFGALWTETARTVFEEVLDFITTYLGWYYVLSVFAFLVFVVWLFFSKYSRIKLGGPQARPEFNLISWLTMLFAAGMGMGLIFWGVAEPVTHFGNPPFEAANTQAAIKEAMRFSFFHWGFHPWAIYIIFGMGIGYFHFRYQLPLAPRSLLYPLIGDRMNSWIGNLVDTLCTVGTLLGVATSLGLGAMQINSGFDSLMDWEYSTQHQLIIIAVITGVATMSTISGLGRGIKYLSISNLFLMLILLLFVLLAGPTLYQLNLFVTTLGDYLQNIVDMSLWIDTRPETDWQSNWTLFYWGWWISWCPFVGVFVARISKGRTIREFIGYVFILPPMVTFFFFSAFGGTALHIEFFGQGGLAEVVDDNVAMSLQALLDQLPWASVTKWLSLVLIIIFFITSSDSGSLVDDIVTSGGHPNPPVLQRAFWGISEGAAAAILLYAGGLNALQTAAISGGLFQSILVIISCIALVKALRIDYHHWKKPGKKKLKG
jgi:choline/glycine/proline betaine transport protein